MEAGFGSARLRSGRFIDWHTKCVIHQSITRLYVIRSKLLRSDELPDNIDFNSAWWIFGSRVGSLEMGNAERPEKFKGRGGGTICRTSLDRELFLVYTKIFRTSLDHFCFLECNRGLLLR